jgi:predicted small secreted protein
MIRTTLVLALVVLTLAGCNTVEGVGEDISGGARTVGNLVGG